MTSWVEEPADATAVVEAEPNTGELEPGQEAAAVPVPRHVPWEAWLLALPYAGLVGGTAAGSLPLVLALLAVVLGGEALLARRRAVAAALGRAQLRTGVRALARAALLVAAVAMAGDASGPAVLALALAPGAVVAARTGWLVLGRRGRRDLRKRGAWRGLDVGGGRSGPAAPPPPGFLGRQATTEDGVLVLEWLLLCGAAVAALTHRDLALAVAAGLVGAGVGVFLGRALRFERSSRRSPRSVVLPGVVAALEDRAPDVVCYFSSPASGSYALRVWVDTLRTLADRVVVVLREAHHLEALDLSGLAVVVLPKAQDVEEAQVASMKVALYPTNVIKNNHMIRLPGIRHAFIGHGDSDKAGSFSPVSRVYDEIWVAGEAGRDRYLAAGEGVRPEQIRQVSRPQLAGVVRRPVDPRPVPTVLYAPTWEGFYDESDYCSVAAPGLEAVRAMVASGRVRVIFK